MGIGATMPSAAKQTETVRERKLRRRGKWAKNRRKNEGSTKSRDELFVVKG
jgi:hypothetical protein